jgi:hypothetical protein
MKPNSRVFALQAAINRYLDDGVRVYSKKDLGVFGADDWERIHASLAQWQSRGLLRVVKPLDEACDDDVVIEMLDYIDQDSPWPNWPPKPAAA